MKSKHKSTMIVLSLALIFCMSCFTNPVFAVSSTFSNTPDLENPVTPDHRGSFQLKNAALLDLIIPETINGVTASAIGDHAFRGCDLLRSVTIPLTIRSIGAKAFADCSNLKVIILEGRTDTSDLYLGEGWSGDAELIFIAPDFQVPSISLEHFMQTLVSARMIKTVDTFSLDQAKGKALSLQQAYDALLPEECTDLLHSEYLEALTTLLALIQDAEKALNSIPAIAEVVPPDSSSDPAMSELTGNAVSETSNEQQNVQNAGQQLQTEPIEPAGEPEHPVESPSDDTQPSASLASSNIEMTNIVPIA